MIHVFNVNVLIAVVIFLNIIELFQQQHRRQYLLSESKCICDRYNVTDNEIINDENTINLHKRLDKIYIDNKTNIYIEREKYTKNILSNMDLTVDPCIDFYQYACGNFFKNYSIKNGYDTLSNWMLVENELVDKSMHLLLNDNNNNFRYESEIKMKNFYKSCMNTENNIFNYSSSNTYMKLINKIFGSWPAKNLTKWKLQNENEFDWFHVMIVMKSININVIVYEDIADDNSIIDISAKHYGLHPSMGSEDYELPYTSTYHINKKLSIFIMEKYNISRKNAIKVIDEIMEFGKNGTNLYESYYNYTDNNILDVTINELIVDIIPEIPEYYWNLYFTNIFGENYSRDIRVNVDDVNYLKNLFDFINGIDKHIVANYLILKLLYELHDEYDYPTYIEDYCLSQVHIYFGPIIDSVYMRSEYRNENAEQEVLNIGIYMKNALQDIIKDKKWLDKETKKEAIKKLKSLFINVDDYENTLDIDELDKQYKNVEINSIKFHENILNLRQYLMRQKHKDLLNGKIYYTTDANAYYLEYRNQVILPTGIFHKPLYYTELPKAYNFGVMGGRILGHEIMHAFDSDCIQYDSNGIKRDWWTINSKLSYMNRVECLIEQYNQYKINEIDKYVNGRKTVGENLSDNGALKISYYGYKKWLKMNEGSIDVTKETLKGLNLTNFQLYFVSYGQGLCGIYNRKGLKRMIDEVHVMEKWRTIGSLSNFNEFSQEFNCKPGTPMNPIKKCIVW